MEKMYKAGKSTGGGLCAKIGLPKALGNTQMKSCYHHYKLSCDCRSYLENRTEC